MRRWMNKDIFIEMIKSFGLNLDDTHLDELFTYVQKILPQLKKIEELNIKDLEPFTTLNLEEL